MSRSPAPRAPQTLRSALRRLRQRHAGILLGYLVLSLVFTWPLAAHPGSHVPGDGIDDPALAWNLWWVKTRLVDQAAPDIFHGAWMFYPIDINLAFYTLTPLNALLSIPVQTAFSLTLASNLILLSSFVLGAYGSYLLARAVTGPLLPAAYSLLSALLAGIVYAFASSKLFYASLGQFNIASSQWIPFCALFAWRLAHSRDLSSSLRNGALAGLFLVFQAWAELTYATFLLLFLALLAIWKLVAVRRGLVPFVAGMVLLGVVTGLGIAPFVIAMLPDLLAEGDIFADGGGFADVFSADLLGFFVPTRLHPIFGEWAARLPFPNDKGQHIFIGYTALALCAAALGSGLRGRAEVRRVIAFWVAALLLFAYLALGPTVRIGGEETGIPGLFTPVSQLPFFGGNRYPSRYSVMLMLCVSVLVPVGAGWILGRLPAPRRADGIADETRRAGRMADDPSERSHRIASMVAVAALGALFLFEHLSLPLPLSDFRTPSIYREIAALPGDGALLELPTGWRNGARVLGRSDVLIMMQQWYQTTHGKRRLGGNTSRNPPIKFQYFTEASLLGDLIALMNADREHLAAAIDPALDEMIERNRMIAPAVLDFLHIDYVTLHLDQASPQLVRFVEEALPVRVLDEWNGTNWRGEPAAIRVYAVAHEAEEDAWEIDPTESTLHLAEGWSRVAVPGTARYAVRERATLLLDIPESGGRLTLEFADDPAPPPGAIRARLNGYPLAAVQPQVERRIVFEIGAALASEPVDRLELHFGGAPRTTLDFATSSPPPATNLLNGHSLVVRSAGEEVGDFAAIYLDGIDLAANQRGYNLVSLDATAGPVRVLESTAFDTHASAEAASAMAEWLRRQAPGTVIAGAIADEASMNLNQEAVDALASLGLTFDGRDKFRWSHAFIAVVGAPAGSTPSGSAVEASGLIQPATVFSGAPLTGPNVYAGLARVRFEP